MTSVASDHPMFSSFSKLDRAATRTVGFEQSAKEALATTRVELVQQAVSNDLIHFILRAKQPLPTSLQLDLAEILYHLRSALDHMVVALAIADQKKSPQKARFPFMLSESEFEMKTREVLKGLPVEVVEAVRAERPWKVASDPLLWAFSQLANVDKHNWLIPFGSAPGIFMSGATIDGGGHPEATGFIFGPGDLNAGYVVAKIGKNGRFCPGNLAVSAKLVFGSDIEVFRHCEASHVLKLLNNRVGQILGRFSDRFFSVK